MFRAALVDDQLRRFVLERGGVLTISVQTFMEG